MPFIFEQKRTLNQTQEKRPVAQPRSSTQRLSAIPRPIKQLVLEPTTSGISHASKPTLDRLPIRTPSKNLYPAKSCNQDGNSKPKTSEPEKTELAVLDLEPFSRQPLVNFDEVKLGTTEIRYVIVRNSLDIQQQLFVKSFPKADKGFYIDATEFLIAPKTEICVALAWTPKFVGGIRESITLQDVNRMPRRIVVMGSAARPKPMPSQHKSSTRKIPRLFRRSPIKINRQMRQERNKLVFSPRATQTKNDKRVKPLTKLISSSPQKRHQLVRKLLSQYDEQMAVKVQSYFRMLLVKRQLATNHEMAIKVQSYFRMLLVKRQIATDNEMATKVQSNFRMLIQKRELQDLRMAVRIQSYLRMLIQIRNLQDQRMAVKVQSYIRMAQERYLFKVKKEEARLKRLKDEQMATKVQSYFRMLQVKRRLAADREKAIKIQSYLRMILVRRQLAVDHERATKIQSYFRMILVRRQLAVDHEMATKIQSYFRMILVQRLLIANHEAATKVQSYFRMILTQRQIASDREMATKVQSYFRMLIQIRNLNDHRMAIKIQSYVRMVQELHRFEVMKEEARVKRLNLLVLWFQSRSRGHLYRRKLSSSIDAIMKIQRRHCEIERRSDLMLM